MIKALISKYLCLHTWEDKIKKDIFYPHGASTEVHIFVCTKCGKIHKIEI